MEGWPGGVFVLEGVFVLRAYEDGRLLGLFPTGVTSLPAFYTWHLVCGKPRRTCRRLAGSSEQKTQADAVQPSPPHRVDDLWYLNQTNVSLLTDNMYPRS